MRAPCNRQRHRRRRLASVALCSILSAFRQTRASGPCSGAALTSAVVAAVASAAGTSTQPSSRAPGEEGYERELLSARDMSDWLVKSAGASMTVDVDVVLVGFHKADVARAQQEEATSGGSGNRVVLDEKTLQWHFNALVEGLSTDGKGGVPMILVRACGGMIALYWAAACDAVVLLSF